MAEPRSLCAACQLPKCTRRSWLCPLERRATRHLTYHTGGRLLPPDPDQNSSYRLCEECHATHIGRVCERCERQGCAHEVVECGECGRRVCFESAHSVRVAGRTCCLECLVQRVDTKPKLVALFGHMPTGIIGHVAWVMERDASAHAAAYATRVRTWSACRKCGVRAPGQRTRRVVCSGRDCARVLSIKPHCVACFASQEWWCHKCTNRRG